MAEDRRIVIPLQISDLFYQSDFFKNNPNYSLSLFCSNMIEKFFEGKLVELTDDNLKEVKQCAAQIGKDPAFVINSIVERFDLVPIVKPDKIKVEVTANTQTVKAIKRIKTNEVINWK